MLELLIINPNTSASVSALLQRHAQAAAGSAARVRTVSARFGAPYIACEASYAVAAHATLDAWAAALAQPGPRPDAVLIGCFGDPGLLALRDCSSVAVTGLAEAAFVQAARVGRFAVVTGGARWKPMLERCAQQSGHATSLAGIHTVAPTGAELAVDPVGARRLLGHACRDAARAFDARAVILGGAGLAGMAADIQPGVEVPVIDSVVAGVSHALWLRGASAPRGSDRFDVEWQHLCIEMTSRGRAG